MSSPIHTAVFDSSQLTAVSSYHSQSVLHNEIAGVSTAFLTFPSSPSPSHRLSPLPDHTLRVLFFISGSGYITQDERSFPIAADDMCLFIPSPLSSFTVTASASSSASLQALSIHWQLSSSPTHSDSIDLTSTLSSSPPLLPFHQPYRTASTYREAIKSPSTVSRTLLPPHVIPRMAIGSVQCKGEDRVGKHRHPMLEQLFLGLPDCDVTVECDAESTRMTAGCLLHIPLGSEHGVWVAEGRQLHYLWIDCFIDKAGTQWIADNHKEDK